MLPKGLTPCREVLLDAKILVSVQYRKTFRGIVTIPLDPQEVLYGANEEDGKQCTFVSLVDSLLSKGLAVYRKTERKVEVVIGIQSVCSVAPTRSFF